MRVVIVGAGGAGLVAALSAKESGAEVVVITKEYPTRSQTCMAQGGINAALSENDSVAEHIQDTLKASAYLADEKMVELMCSSAPDTIRWLDSMGMPFSRDESAHIAQRRLGGAKYPRACYAQDYTGLKLLHTLYDKCLEAGISFLNEKFLQEIVVEEQRAAGVVVIDKKSGEVEVVPADSVVMATGGYSRIYHTNSTNSSASSGDGVAAAYRAGAILRDMEFVQFHPTALKNSSILISESARGAGGYLLNSKGKRFVDELLPRDEVARAIDREIKNGESVYLDIRHLGAEFIEEELPQEAKLSRLYEGVDPLHEPIPIKPAAHYTMGGIAVDENCETNINGLFAVGECASHGVHGANRLGGNSLLELVVFGRVAGKSAANRTPFDLKLDGSKIKERLQAEIALLKEQPNEVSFYSKMEQIGNIFYESVGIVRDEKSLDGVSFLLGEIEKELPLMGVGDKSAVFNSNFFDRKEFENMLLVAKIVLACATKRQESRGAHYRGDFAVQNSESIVHSMASLTRGVWHES